MATRTWPKTRDGVGSNSGKGNCTPFVTHSTPAWLQQRYIRSFLWVGLLLDVWDTCTSSRLVKELTKSSNFRGLSKSPLCYVLPTWKYVHLRCDARRYGL